MAARSLVLRVCRPMINGHWTPVKCQSFHTSLFNNTGKIGPAVRSTLDIYGLDASKLTATGPQGILLKGDILKYINTNQLKPATISLVVLPSGMSIAPPTLTDVKKELKPTAQVSTKSVPKFKERKPDDGFTDIQISNMRRTIAKRLTESKTAIPHAYATIDCVMENVNQLRKDLKEDGIRLSVNDFIIKAAAVALQQVPEANVIWSGEDARMVNNIDISVAVATEGGLITPIVNDAIGIGLQDISNKVRDLAARAKEGKLKPHEYQGGTFTISNLGMFGISEFSAVINPPQACILAVGTSRLLLDGDGYPQTITTVTLSTDCRIVSDDVASKYLDAFKYVIENPMSMLTHKIHVERSDIMDKLFAK